MKWDPDPFCSLDLPDHLVGVLISWKPLAAADDGHTDKLEIRQFTVNGTIRIHESGIRLLESGICS